jgi:hypothetical protein
MSNVVAPLPSGVGVTAIAEHHARRDPDRHHSADDEGKAEEHSSGAQEQGGRRTPHPAGGAPPLLADEPGVPAETLFAATLFANDLLQVPPSAEEVRLRNGQGWSPPDSALKLKDKLI